MIFIEPYLIYEIFLDEAKSRFFAYDSLYTEKYICSDTSLTYLKEKLDTIWSDEPRQHSLVVRLPCKQQVRGSNPLRGTKRKEIICFDCK